MQTLTAHDRAAVIKSIALIARALPKLIAEGRVEKRPNYPGRAYILHDKSEASIRLDWNGEKRNWIVTAYPLNKEIPGAMDGCRTYVHTFGGKQSFPLPHSENDKKKVSPSRPRVKHLSPEYRALLASKIRELIAEARNLNEVKESL